MLTVPASHERTQKTTEDTDTFYFHCVKAWEPILKVRLQVTTGHYTVLLFILLAYFQCDPNSKELHCFCSVNTTHAFCFEQKISDKEDENSNLSDTLTVPLKFLPVGHKVKVTLPVRHVSVS